MLLKAGDGFGMRGRPGLETLRVVLLLVLAGAIWAALRWTRYPGGRGFAFGSTYADDRRDLAQARSKLREAERAGHDRVSRARNSLQAAETRHRESVRARQRRIAALLAPGPGSLERRLGGLALHTHVLRAGTEEIRLDGLRVRFEGSAKFHYIYLTRAGGKVSKHEYAPELHEEDEVRGFAVDIENAVVTETERLAKYKDEMERLKEELQQAIDDTTEQDSARERLDQVTQEQQQDDRIEQARLELEQARDRWQSLTGRRPR